MIRLPSLSRTVMRAIVLVLSVLALSDLALQLSQALFSRNRPAIDDCLWREAFSFTTKQLQGYGWQSPLPDQAVIIFDVLEGGEAERAGIRPGVRLVMLDGDSVRSSQQAQRLLNRADLNQPVRYGIVRPNGRHEIVSVRVEKQSQIGFIGLALWGVCFLLLGLLVVATKPESPVARHFFGLGMAAALGSNIYAVGLNVGGVAPHPFWTMLYWSCWVQFFPGLWLFFLKFPRLHPILKRWPSLNRWPYILNGVVALIGLAGAWVFGERPDGFFRLFTLLAFIYAVFAIVACIRSYRHAENARERRSMRMLLVGLIVGMLALSYLVIWSRLLPANALIYNQGLALLPGLLALALPVAFLMAIIRYHIMDVQVLIRRSLLYTTLSLMTAAAYVGFLALLTNVLDGRLGNLTRVLDDRFGTEKGTVTLLAVVAVAFMITPLRTWVQALIDRRFDRGQHDYVQMLLTLSQELPRHIDSDEILSLIGEQTVQAMRPTHLQIVVRSDTQGFESAWSSVGDHQPTDLTLLALVERAQFRRTCCSLVSPEDLARLTPEVVADLKRIGIHLAVPMVTRGEALVGLLLLGPKRSEQPYSAEDQTLLLTVAGQSAIALENARLQRMALDQKQIQTELALARDVQSSLAPVQLPEISGLAFAAHAEPAQSVGGDFYDVFRLSGNRVLIAVGDVSGKGISAALYAAQVQGLLQAAAQFLLTPAEILTEVNNRLRSGGMKRTYFVTIVLAIVDGDRGTIQICRAGHNPPLRSQPKGESSWVQPGGLGLGLADGRLFGRSLQTWSAPLVAGERFVFYSDGLTEAMNAGSDEFGADRFAALVTQSSGLSPQMLNQRLADAIRSHRMGIPANDDTTWVIADVVQPTARQTTDAAGVFTSVALPLPT